MAMSSKWEPSVRLLNSIPPLARPYLAPVVSRAILARLGLVECNG